MAETEESKKHTKGHDSHVRFSEEEFERLTREREITGKSIPTLLKESHFRRDEIVPLMHPSDQKSVAINASLILEEVRSLRERMPALPFSELEKLLRDVNEKVHTIFLFVTGTYGNR